MGQMTFAVATPVGPSGEAGGRVDRSVEQQGNLPRDAENPPPAKPIEPGTDARADLRLVTIDTSTIEGEVTKFTIRGVSPGDWAFVVTVSQGDKAQQARLQYAGNRNIHDAVLAFAPEPHLYLDVNGKPFRNSDKSGLTFVLYRPTETRGVEYGVSVASLPVGAYKLMVSTGFDCVESFLPGDVPVSDGNLLITARKYAQSVSVKVGGHCGHLTILLPKRVSSPPAILLVPELLPFQPITARLPAVDLASTTTLSRYLLVATASMHLRPSMAWNTRTLRC